MEKLLKKKLKRIEKDIYFFESLPRLTKEEKEIVKVLKVKYSTISDIIKEVA